MADAVDLSALLRRLGAEIGPLESILFTDVRIAHAIERVFGVWHKVHSGPTEAEWLQAAYADTLAAFHDGFLPSPHDRPDDPVVIVLPSGAVWRTRVPRRADGRPLTTPPTR